MAPRNRSPSDVGIVNGHLAGKPVVFDPNLPRDGYHILQPDSPRRFARTSALIGLPAAVGWLVASASAHPFSSPASAPLFLAASLSLTLFCGTAVLRAFLRYIGSNLAPTAAFRACLAALSALPGASALTTFVPLAVLIFDRHDPQELLAVTTVAIPPAFAYSFLAFETGDALRLSCPLASLPFAAAIREQQTSTIVLSLLVLSLLGLAFVAFASIVGGAE